MKKIEIRKLTEDEIQSSGIRNWPIWTKEISTFDWYYDATEYCLILSGEVTVKTDLEELKISSGDFVKFPKGLSCVWEISSPIRKHYNFE